MNDYCNHLIKTGKKIIVSYAQINLYPRSLHRIPKSSMLMGGTGLGFGVEGRDTEEGLEIKCEINPV